METYSFKHLPRKRVDWVLNWLHDKDISFSFDGGEETLDFDITELSKREQEIILSHLKPIKESKVKRVNERKLERYINKIIENKIKKYL